MKTALRTDNVSTRPRWHSVRAAARGPLLFLPAACAALVASLVMSGVRPGGTVQAQLAGNGQTDLSQTISAIGEGDAAASPDVAILSLAVQNEARTAREAIDQNSAAMAAVITALKQIGIEDRHLRTSGLSLNPVRARPRPEDTQPPPVTGYQAVNSLSVTVTPVSKAGEAIDVAVSAGANVAGGIQFAVADDTELQRRALDEAVKAARSKADAMAAAAGVRVTGIRLMTEEPLGGVPVARAELAQASDARAGGLAPPVQPGELTLRTRARVVFNFG